MAIEKIRVGIIGASMRNGWGAMLPRAGLGSPGYRARCLRTCTGSLTARDSGTPRDIGAPDGAFRISLQRRRPGVILLRG
jgi:hypothetical protein